MDPVTKRRIRKGMMAVLCARNSGDATRVAATVVELGRLATPSFASKVALCNRKLLLQTIMELAQKDRYECGQALMEGWAADWK